MRLRPAQSEPQTTIEPPNGWMPRPTPQPRSPSAASLPPYATERLPIGVTVWLIDEVPAAPAGPPMPVGSFQSTESITPPAEMRADGPFSFARAAGSANAAPESFCAATADADTPRSRGLVFGSE